jgi:cytoskeletal protein CcmA (bactofilin family)
MRIQKNNIISLSLFLMLLIPQSLFAMPESGEIVTQRGSVDDDYYAAGGTIDINALISGDVVVAGGELFIGHDIKGDVIAAGGSINLRGDIQDDVRVAGGDILIDANIGDDLIASGGRINVSSSSAVAGEAWLAGGDVNIAGKVNNNVYIGAGSVRISGFVHGDVTIEAGEIHILEGAFIDGSLLYRSPHEAIIHTDARISGDIIYEQVEWERPHSGAGIFFVITMIVASIVLYKLFPVFTMSTVARISGDPLKSLGAGFLILILTPLTAALLMAIVVGFWVGLSIMALYLVALIVGYLSACFFVSDWVAKRFNKDISTTGRRFISVALAIIVLGLLSNIPLIGGLLNFVLLLLGLGAVMMQLKEVYRQSAER